MEEEGKRKEIKTTVEFTEKEVKKYLDDCIRFWRDKRKEGNKMAMYYVDAFQSVRSSLFGELLP